MKERKDAIKDLLLPSYDEYSIFLMNFSFLLVFLFDQACRTEVLSYYIPPASADKRPLFFIIIVTLMFIAGLGASLYHAFKKGPKDIISETFSISVTFTTNCNHFLAKGSSYVKGRFLGTQKYV